MPISELRELVDKRLLDFVWNEWAQMGILATPRFESPWAADPEALLLLTLETGRSDPRVFDETLDWLTVNGGLVSQQRLRNLCVDDDDRKLVDAMLAWGGARQPALRSARVRAAGGGGGEVQQLFYPSVRFAAPDPIFEAHGWLRGPAEPSGNS